MDIGTRSFFIVVSVALLLVVSSRPAAANLIANPSFETAESTDDGPSSSTGDWGGDGSTIVPAESGITPHDGNRMLRFDFSFGKSGTNGGSSDVWQTLSTAGGVLFEASAFFNRVAGDSTTDTEFQIQIRAFDGMASDFPTDNGNFDAISMTSVFTDSDPDTWEKATTSLFLPAGTTYVGIGIRAIENVTNNSSAPEFDGHYADTVSAAVVPEPGTLAMIGSALLLFGLRRRSRRT